MNQHLASGFLLGILSLPALATTTESIQPETGFSSTDKQAVKATSHMVSVANPLAAGAGLEVLNNGGSAMDAAVAVQFVLNLVEPQSSGIGGGAFLLHYDAESGRLETLDGRETAPMAIQEDHFLEADGQPMKWWKRITGGKSVGVPGTLKLLEVAHQKYGKQQWARLLQPAIDLAREGFAVSPRMSNSIAEAADRGLKTFDTTRQYFFDNSGAALPEGHVLKNPQFATSLEKIQNQGSRVFYEGEIGQAIVDTVQNASVNPANLTMDDLGNYRVKFRPAVCSAYRSHQICGMGPPSSGGLTVGQIMGILNHHQLDGTSFNANNIHLISEAQKLAYADRAKYMADSDFVAVPVFGLLEADYLSSRAALISPLQAMEKATAGEPQWLQSAEKAIESYQRELTGTSHFSIVDQDGNAVSMTTTIESGFGSRLMSGGFLLNNELTDFSAVPLKDGELIANRIDPGKRPRSSMAPTMVFDSNDNLVLIIGSPGGSRIINYVVKVLVGVLDFGLNVQQAISAPNFSNRNGATDLEESSAAEDWVDDLEALGQGIKVRNLNSGLHGIQRLPDGSLVGGADPRREGVALGN